MDGGNNAAGGEQCGARGKPIVGHYTPSPEGMSLGVTVTPLGAASLPWVSPWAGLERLLCSAIPGEAGGTKGDQGTMIQSTGWLLQLNSA